MPACQRSACTAACRSGCSVFAWTSATCSGGTSDTVRGVPASGASTTVPVAAMPERATVKPASIVSNSSVFHASIGRSNGTGTTVSGSARASAADSARAGSSSSRRTPASASRAASCAGHASPVAHQTSACDAASAACIVRASVCGSCAASVCMRRVS